MNLYEQAEHFGLDNRLNQMMEEFAETISVAARYRRMLSGDGTLHYSQRSLKRNMAEEIADSKMVMEQVSYLLDITKEQIDDNIDKKLIRTERMINNGKGRDTAVAEDY